jgi:hypothetical protein
MSAYHRWAYEEVRLNPIPDYSQLTEDALLAILAEQLYGGHTQDFGPSDVQQRINDARAWIDGWISRNRRALCKELESRGMQSSGIVDAIVDSATLIDLIAGIGGNLNHTSVAVISALVLKWGIRNLCS